MPSSTERPMAPAIPSTVNTPTPGHHERGQQQLRPAARVDRQRMRRSPRWGRACTEGALNEATRVNGDALAGCPEGAPSGLASGPRRRLITLLAVSLLLLLPAAAAAAKRPKPVRLAVDAPEVFSVADGTSHGIEALGLVQGVFGRAGLDARLRSSGSGQEGPVALFDGRGEIRGILHVTIAGTGDYGGRLTVTGGSGRYSRVTGTLTLSGTTDTTSVPGVTVYPGRLRGSLHFTPGSAPSPAHTAVHVDLHGKQTKLAFHVTPGRPYVAQLTAAGETSLPRIGTGVLILVTDIYADGRRPVTATFLGADGTWSVRDSTLTATTLSAITPARVIAGTGRYRGAYGSLSYTVPTSSSTGGVSSRLFVSRLFGTLRF